MIKERRVRAEFKLTESAAGPPGESIRRGSNLEPLLLSPEEDESLHGLLNQALEKNIGKARAERRKLSQASTLLQSTVW